VYHFGVYDPTLKFLSALRLAKWEQITVVVSGVISFDSGHLKGKFWNSSQAPRSKVNLVITFKKQVQQVTQMIQRVTYQDEMTNQLDFRDTAKQKELLTNQVKLTTNCSQIKLLTYQVGESRNEGPCCWCWCCSTE
jgi:hypothetical protein